MTAFVSNRPIRHKYSAKLNFLSHYYFYRYERNPELTLGCVLPDLLRNADKSLRLQPERWETALLAHPKLQNIYTGWKHHVETDRIFHNLPFFYEHTHALRVRLVPVVEGTPIRASFLSHIALELLLDHLLLIRGMADDADFYNDLEKVDRQALDRFLKICVMEDSAVFFRFYDRFLADRYVGYYREMGEVTRALLNICRRLWDVRLDTETRQLMTAQLTEYAGVLSENFQQVFDEIEYKIT